MSNSFNQIIDLIKKTGDNCVVVDEGGQPSFVILPFKIYQKLVEDKSGMADLTEEEFLDKINRDVALWRENQKELDWQAEDYLDRPDIDDKCDEDLEFEEEVKKYYFEPIE